MSITRTGIDTYNKPAILCMDPSISTGWGYVVVAAGTDEILYTNVIKTHSNTGKIKNLRMGDDRVRRVAELAQELQSIHRRFNIIYIVTEIQHGAQNSKGAIGVGIVTGIIPTFALLTGIPAEYYYEADAKKKVLGKKTGTKNDMKAAIDKLYDVVWTGIKYKDEGIADSLAIHYTAMHESTTLKMLDNMSEGGNLNLGRQK